jgi:hypothetical protein
MPLEFGAPQYRESNTVLQICCRTVDLGLMLRLSAKAVEAVRGMFVVMVGRSWEAAVSV